MSFINSILKVFVGDKSQKDVNALQGNITKVKSFESALESLSHDELRAKTTYFKELIKQARSDKDLKIASLQAEVETIEDIDKREDLYLEIDALEKEAYDISEKTLNDILPEAFAVIKETAKRFTQNESITVTATPFDRELSATKANVTLENEKAIWANTWDAQGKEVEKFNKVMYQEMPEQALQQIIKNQGIGYKIDEEYYYHKGEYKEDETLSRKEKKLIKSKDKSGDKKEENKYKNNFIGLVSFIKMLFEETVDENILKYIAYKIIIIIDDL